MPNVACHLCQGCKVCDPGFRNDWLSGLHASDQLHADSGRWVPSRSRCRVVVSSQMSTDLPPVACSKPSSARETNANGRLLSARVLGEVVAKVDASPTGFEAVA